MTGYTYIIVSRSYFLVLIKLITKTILRIDHYKVSIIERLSVFDTAQYAL
jgi:hypothetical protein